MQTKTTNIVMALVCLAFSTSSFAQGTLRDEGFPDFFKTAKHYTWDGTQWKEDGKIYADTASGHPPVKYNFDILSGSYYLPFQRFTMLLNASNETVRMISEKYSGSAWSPFEKDTVMYDSNGKLQYRYKYLYSGGAWQNEYKNTYTLNGSGAIAERFEEDWYGSAWQNDDDYFFNYDGNGRLTSILDKDWQGTWVERRRNLVNYDANGVETDVVKQELISGVWTNKEKFEFAPSTTTGITKSSQSLLTVYPNPSNGIISITLPLNATLSVLNVNGEVVFGKYLESGKSALDLSSLPKGVYVVKAVSPEGISVSRVILQ